MLTAKSSKALLHRLSDGSSNVNYHPWNARSKPLGFRVIFALEFLAVLVLSISFVPMARADLVVVATIQIGHVVAGEAYDSGKGEVFVADYNSKSVSVISDITPNLVATIPVGRPYGVAYDSGKGEVFVANNAGLALSTVSVISDATNAVVATVNVGKG